MGTPLVSVVIPTYNSREFLAETLGSVRAQTFTDFEVVVVDDGSTDGTPDLAAGYSTLMPLRLLVQPNAGPARARNRGIREARGRYIAFIDADDLMEPQRLELQVQALEHEPALALVHTDLMTFNENGVIHSTRRAFSSPAGGHVLDRLLLDNFITTSTVMAPAERLVEAGLFNEKRRISEDFELWLKMAESRPIGYIERPLVRYRTRGASLSGDKLRTGLVALDVVDVFWREHPELAARQPVLRRRSLAAHCAFAARAALQQGEVRRAFALLFRAAGFEPGNPEVWKLMAKGGLRAVGYGRR